MIGRAVGIAFCDMDMLYHSQEPGEKLSGVCSVRTHCDLACPWFQQTSTAEDENTRGRIGKYATIRFLGYYSIGS